MTRAANAYAIVSIQIYDTTDPVASPNAPNTPLMMPVASGTDAIMIELYTDIAKPSQRKPFFASI